MALAILTTKTIENVETASESTNFLASTIRNIFKRHESEIEYNDSLKQISLEEVRHHDCWEDCWIIIYDRVYDITQFLHQVSDLINLRLSNCNEPQKLKKKEFKRVYNFFY